jgi:tetratricopeptide (TPR) repeat protein
MYPLLRYAPALLPSTGMHNAPDRGSICGRGIAPNKFYCEVIMGTRLEAVMRSLGIAGICSILLVSGACLAMDTPEDPQALQLDADYAAGKAAIDIKDWGAAVKSLSSAAEHNPKNADIQNLLGYANRKLGNLDLAFKHYGLALELNPNHRGAHEYVGETYLLANNPAKAEEHLAALNKICFVPCAEYRDLKNAIAAYKQRDTNKTSSAADDSKTY